MSCRQWFVMSALALLYTTEIPIAYSGRLGGEITVDKLAVMACDVDRMFYSIREECRLLFVPHKLLTTKNDLLSAEILELKGQFIVFISSQRNTAQLYALKSCMVLCFLTRIIILCSPLLMLTVGFRAVLPLFFLLALLFTAASCAGANAHLEMKSEAFLCVAAAWGMCAIRFAPNDDRGNFNQVAPGNPASTVQIALGVCSADHSEITSVDSVHRALDDERRLLESDRRCFEAEKRALQAEQRALDAGRGNMSTPTGSARRASTPVPGSRY